MNCRFCSNRLEHTFLDLGFAPLSNAFLSYPELSKPEQYFPLKTKVCNHCWLVQTDDYSKAKEIFNVEYPYFSSSSSSWLKHTKDFCNSIFNELNLNSNSFVIEIASNDGYLLKNFLDLKVPCLGIEPTSSTAAKAKELGIPVLEEFFDEDSANKLAKENKKADLIIGNNVYAHVPNLNSFTKGLKQALKTGGTITLEFPHLLELLRQNQFDTIYHEHFSYLSLSTVKRIFEKFSLRIWKVEQIPTHGGSLRIYGCHTESKRKTDISVDCLLKKEIEYGIEKLSTYLEFGNNIEKIKLEFLRFLIDKKTELKSVAGYGAAAKGNTLLNYSGIKQDLLPFVFDLSPKKQNKFLPGSHIPVLPPSEIKNLKPDFLIIFPWNIKNEIMSQHSYIKDWGGSFVVIQPEIQFF